VKIELAAATFRGIHDETMNEGEEDSGATCGDAHGGGGGGGGRRKGIRAPSAKTEVYGLPSAFPVFSV